MKFILTRQTWKVFLRERSHMWREIIAKMFALQRDHNPTCNPHASTEQNRSFILFLLTCIRSCLSVYMQKGENRKTSWGSIFSFIEHLDARCSLKGEWHRMYFCLLPNVVRWHVLLVALANCPRERDWNVKEGQKYSYDKYCSSRRHILLKSSHSLPLPTPGHPLP